MVQPDLVDLDTLRETLERAVKKRLMSISAVWRLAAWCLAVWWARLQPDCCDRSASPRQQTRNERIRFRLVLKARRPNTNHHEYTFTIQEALDAVRGVIYHLETYNVTTIRASTSHVPAFA